MCCTVPCTMLMCGLWKRVISAYCVWTPGWDLLVWGLGSHHPNRVLHGKGWGCRLCRHFVVEGTEQEMAAAAHRFCRYYSSDLRRNKNLYLGGGRGRGKGWLTQRLYIIYFWFLNSMFGKSCQNLRAVMW